MALPELLTNGNGKIILFFLKVFIENYCQPGV